MCKRFQAEQESALLPPFFTEVCDPVKAGSHTQSIEVFFRVRLALHSACCHTLDDILLAEQIDNNDGQDA